MSERHSHRATAIAHLAQLIRDVRVAMMTTRAADGRLLSRRMGTKEVGFDGDLWFATGWDSDKVREIQADPRVNVAYASADGNTYVSVAGTASLVRDRKRIDALWSPSMGRFFPGGKDDPDLCLIRVNAESAEYWDGPGEMLGQALHFVLSAVTDDPASLTENERLDLRR